jgi:biopolymer transport protein ExbB/biopolymer transport protein TolQ
MSAWSVGIMIDRALMFSAARKQSRVFVQQVAGALKDNKLDEAISIAERNKKSHIAKVVATGLSEFQAASAQVSDEEVIEAARRGLERSVAIVHAEMKRGLSGLASASSARSSASSTRSKALRAAKRPVSRPWPAVFPKPS